MKLLSPQFLVLLTLIPVIWMMTGHSQVFGHSQLSLHKSRRFSSIIGILTKVSKVALWTVLVVAFCRVQVTGYGVKTEPGGVIDVLQDVSGSMKDGITDKLEIQLAGPGFDKPPPTPYQNIAVGGLGAYMMDQRPSTKQPQRIDAAQGAIKLFVEHSHGLRISLTSFDNQMYYQFPPTRDHKVVLDLLPSVRAYVQERGGGTNFDGPNGLEALNDGALQGAINVLSRVPDGQARILIMVTDGDSSINPARAQQLIEQFKQLNIRMFVFGIGPDWAENADSVQPLKNFIMAVDGEVAPLQDEAKFNVMLAHIDSLARSTSHRFRENDYKDAILELLALAGLIGAIYLALSALSREQL